MQVVQTGLPLIEFCRETNLPSAELRRKDLQKVLMQVDTLCSYSQLPGLSMISMPCGLACANLDIDQHPVKQRSNWLTKDDFLNVCILQIKMKGRLASRVMSLSPPAPQLLSHQAPPSHTRQAVSWRGIQMQLTMLRQVHLPG